MTEKKIAPIEIRIDASEAEIQVNEIAKLLEFPASSFEGLPQHIVNLFFSHIRSLIDNIVPGDFSTTISTENINEIAVKVKIVGPLEHLATAIRTNGLHGLHEHILSTVGELKD
jgi:di/tripeptidase